MALVTIAGYPCSGKSRIARMLADDFRARLQSSEYDGPKFEVVVVDDDSSHVPRSVYDDSKVEKSGRANLFSNVTRSLGQETITICDSLNYIKGFRYQMYCAAREASCRVCTVYVATPPERCTEWHEERGECSYKSTTFENLIMRFEEPSSMVRWDSPLVTISPDEEPPLEEIWNIVTKGEKKGPNAARPKPPPNTLLILTNTTHTITTSLLAHLNAGPATSTYIVPCPPAASAGSLTLHLPMRRVTLPEMQRLKRQAAGSWSESEVASAFVRFLETVWATAP
ncbi:chromatin associated protein KTI12 [Kockovaella imperatae]|uniref:Chromatin associated protein KTI12 n=1 Tax=Kockovaella imperatae TaxID=4999 RepID=A0A1Y1UC25_9TREE|nr:chromatin associated protein KTI12 [Kockovaella imperatae]ORX34635.1 chromatin associated protein KTI12 [Kockovaella imperatae]